MKSGQCIEACLVLETRDQTKTVGTRPRPGPRLQPSRLRSRPRH